MATYGYRCPWDGDFELRFAIGTATASSPCPTCGCDARRVFSPPSLARTPPALAAAIDASWRSAETPEVVSSVPARSREPGRT
ncbi:zinc ribbon domain-containing protein [Planosporangium mesophilum]|uniref:Putative regulatory protein FmdB zinc ribbon domain-containing protein n=1 Tax=Planosporangium mesophilum TaxID=689768 RepID=A0A8J3TF29_9ACTN|nr:zinc ribbon domain-containing protein [Planosporangium mesophilum]NJC86701.1 zinc ribbon domain-containing protein [Planosporangium mesophilum]GII25673.1 hypothetical protein Pme01_52700 [Planosporangium mesophilum]